MSAEQKHGILVALDDSEASQQALRYVAHMTQGRSRFRLRLLHVLPSVPPALLEHGGSADPVKEAELDRELREARQQWIAQAEQEAQPLFERAKEQLEAGGFDSADIETECRASISGQAVARDCIEAARDSGCRTVAIGRSMLPWYREVLHKHPCDELVKHGDGLTIWIVEWE